jgi:2-polyprenyl-6-methoxyphenol hydroxylase-like FAD-dependent oxidoreductase
MTNGMLPLASDMAVLICGAGAAGLTLAIELARRGVPFRLIDRLAEPFPGSRGKGLQPRTLEVFDDLGVVDRIFAAGGPYPLQRMHRSDGGFTDRPLFADPPATPSEPYATPLMLPQFMTEAILRERLLELGHRPAFGHALVGFDQDDHGVTAQIAGPRGEEILRVRYLVGADGGRSFVRKAIGVDFPGETLGVHALVADVLLTGLSRDAWHRFNDADPAGQLMICPLAGTDMFQIQAPVPPDRATDLSPEGLTALIAGRSGRTDIHVHSVSWASDYSMSARLADRYRVGRVFLTGDAAHVHPPTGGQGLNTSVQDAYNLGWKLAAAIGSAPQALLDTYEEERRPIAAGMLGLSTRLLDDAKKGEIRRDRETRQLDIGYRDSSLSLQRPGREQRREQGLAAGDRAPDATLRGRAGQAMRLFDLFRGTHWTLLGYDVARACLAPRPGLRICVIGPGSECTDPAAQFRQAYGSEAGDWFLIRPDGYIAAIVGTANRAALEPCLAAVGLGPGSRGDA